MRNNDFSFLDEKNSENLARFFKFCAWYYRGCSLHELTSTLILLPTRRFTLNWGNGTASLSIFRLYRFRRFVFLSFFDALSKLLSLWQQRCCRESLSLRLGFCLKHLWMRQFHFSYFHIGRHTATPASGTVLRSRHSRSKSQTKTPTR